MQKTQINLQDTFLNQLRKERIPVNIHVTNGYQIKDALIVGYDSFVLLLEAEGKQMMLYKHAVSSITPSQKINIRSMIQGAEKGEEIG